jgi:uroporphyrinogen decarboxylase
MRIGMEGLLVAMLEQPDFVHELFAAHAQLVIDIYQHMRSLGMEFDGAFLADDLGYRTAPLISPRLYRELVLPHHKRLCERFARDGLKTILHSDGHVTPLIPYFLESGFAALHPLEVKAGLDAVELKAEYGKRLVLFGNIDARALSGTRADIEAEIVRKVPAAKAGGGYIYHSDHSVPNTVSFENYAFAIELVRRYGAYD